MSTPSTRSLYSWVYKHDALTGVDSVVGTFQPEALRPVLFVFYTLEAVVNMFCMGYHIKGFQVTQMNMLSWDGQAIHYFYLVVFYVFMVLTLFQSVNICTGHRVTVNMEIWKASTAAIVFILISLTSMWDAERFFHMFLMNSNVQITKGDFVQDQPVHPYSQYLQGQSIASLACGMLYLLHASIMIDVKLTSDLNTGLGRGSYMPIPLFVLGREIHAKLNNYHWFRDLCANEPIYI
ncbi:uncharacterized protein LOC108086801 [Drosophila ficusphila]|uniref:uncharacterized protein LOC108086801 n=1 Tax=Drosophila ficusphila TaxID=30025 RepID=UPI0007E5C15E|nr:uncharacterized protein LOC108086801 [Drosophila ficusphila]